MTVKRKRLSKADRHEREEQRRRVLENARRTRELAERAQAKLETQRSGE
jgi:hypothetical protein